MTLKNLEKPIAGQAIRPQECSSVNFQTTEWAARCEPLRGFRQRDTNFQLRGRNRIVGIDNITLKKLKLVQNQDAAAVTFNNPEKAIVDEEIRPNECGRVHFQNSWWPAKCDLEITFQKGELVRVVGIDNITLIVGP
ncbi:NfeD family protein [Microcoleus sp. herbarium7]|uniref:NfeD family protein n=1 Tax=Microcoleus sp. herbarium7 TaxID=3055435 RepID=UPI002FD3F7BD